MGLQPPLVVLPGWGFTGAVFTEHPAFSAADLITSMDFSSPSMLTDLLGFLDARQIARVRVLGWSMGGNLAIDLALKHPQYIESLMLVAVRRSWPADEVAATRQGLSAPEQGLVKFHRKCFLGAQKEYKRFAPLLTQPEGEAELAVLDGGLSYLASYTMPESLPLPVKIIQGDKDVVCPQAEMVKFASKTKTLILAGVGHFLFSHPEFTL